MWNHINDDREALTEKQKWRNKDMELGKRNKRDGEAIRKIVRWGNSAVEWR